MIGKIKRDKIFTINTLQKMHPPLKILAEGSLRSSKIAWNSIHHCSVYFFQHTFSSSTFKMLQLPSVALYCLWKQKCRFCLGTPESWFFPPRPLLLFHSYFFMIARESQTLKEPAVDRLEDWMIESWRYKKEQFGKNSFGKCQPNTLSPPL